MANEKMFTVDKFLGLNEVADGFSELKMGAASRMVNFSVTDAGNITVRPGFSKIPFFADTDKILTMWAGYIRNDQYIVAADMTQGADRLTVLRVEGTLFTAIAERSGLLGLAGAAGEVVKIFPFGEKVYVMSPSANLSIQIDETGAQIQSETPYVPTVVTGADAMGGGTQLERINLLSSQRRIVYSCDGESTNYVLPSEAVAVLQAATDSGDLEFTFDAKNHTVTFQQPPEEGVTNLTVTYDTDHEAAAASRKLVTSMPYWENYNGATDTRLFFYGDGSNITFYTDIPESGKADPLYVPAMNEIAVDFSGSPITGMIRHYNKLMVFKPDGAHAITYEPVTLTDGTVTAGFYLRTINKTIGSDTHSQVQLVNNNPRTICAKSLYEWKVSSHSVGDERYANRISDNVARSLASADPAKIVTCDDNSTHTYYIFLNDTNGTILAHRYNLNVWCLHRSPLAVGVKQATICENNLVFRTDYGIFFLDQSARFDSDGVNSYAIPAVWESGYMDFGENYRRKFTSFLWFGIKPESYSALTITAASDRKSNYAEKTIRSELFDYGKINYAKWSYDASSAIRTRRVKLKVKKAIFYKLIIKVNEPGARATVLGYDQLVRFTSLVK